MTILFLVVLLISLFFLSRLLNSSLFLLFYLITHSRNTSITTTSLILFPGTIVHELAHLFTAEILGVRTGKLSLIPEIIDEQSIQAGSVQVAKTDPLRRTFIGLAPLLIGIIVVTLLSSTLTSKFPDFWLQLQQPEPWKNASIYLFLLLGYLLFAIVNNMFPSKEDMNGVSPILILLGFFLIVAYVVGVRFTLDGRALYYYTAITNAVTHYLAIVIGINIVLLILVRGTLLLIRRRF